MSLATSTSDFTKFKTFIVISAIVATAAAVGFGLFRITSAESTTSHKPPSQRKQERQEPQKDAEKYDEMLMDQADANSATITSNQLKPSSKSASSGPVSSLGSASSPEKSYSKVASSAVTSPVPFVSSKDARSDSAPVVSPATAPKPDFHPACDEMSNFFYKNSKGEVCSVYSLLTESHVSFETLPLDNPSYHNDDDDCDKHHQKEPKQNHESGKPNGQGRTFQTDDTGIQHPKSTENIKDDQNTESEYVSQADSSPPKQCEEDDEKTALNLLNTSESEPSQNAKYQKQDSLETATMPLTSSKIAECEITEPITLKSPAPEIAVLDENSDEESPTAVSLVPTAADRRAHVKKTQSFNVEASEFVPYASLPSYPGQASVDFPEAGSGYYDYQFEGASNFNEINPYWNPYGAVAQDNMEYMYYAVDQPYCRDDGKSFTHKQSSQTVRKGNSKGKRHPKRQSNSLQVHKHEKTRLGDFIEFNLDGSNSSANVGASRKRQTSSSICLFGLTCANKECIYIHQ